jgi:hypothetical protein
VRFWGYAGSETSATDTLALVTYDPDNPGGGTARIAGRSALHGEPYAMPGGRYENSSATGVSVSEYRHQTLAYASGSALFKLSLDKSSNAAPQRLSAETAAGRACQRQEQQSQFFQLGAPDYTNHARSTLIYQVPGTDGLCATADDTWRAVKLSMGAGERPIDIGGEPLVPLYDVATGALSGWLIVRSGGLGPQRTITLARVDADFVNASDIATLRSPWRLLGRVPNQGAFAGDVLMASGDEVRRFDTRTGAWSAPLAAAVADTREMLLAADAAHAYFVRSGFGVDDILKVPLDGSAPAALVASAEGPVWDLAVSSMHVLYRTWDGALHSVHKDTLAPLQNPIGTLADGSEARVARAGETLSLSGRSLPAGGQAEASFVSLVKGDGTALVNLAKAELLGDAVPSLRADGARGRVIVAQGMQADGSGYLGFAGASIEAYDAATGGANVTLGSLPRASVEVGGVSVSAGFGQRVTLSAVGFDRTSGARYFDLYLAEADKAGTLTRITRNIP